YLDALVRGVYAARNLSADDELTDSDVYFAIPLQRGQISCREFIPAQRLLRSIRADEPLTIDMMEGAFTDFKLRELIKQRGLCPTGPDEIQRNGHMQRSKPRKTSHSY